MTPKSERKYFTGTRAILWLLTTAAASFLSAPTCAEVEARAIVQNSIQAAYYPGEDGRSQVSMRILDQQGRERTRRLTLLRRNSESDDEAQKYYAYFSRPSDVEKMVFMAWKNPSRSDDRWLYLPALDLVKRIAASDERTSFVGSHFFYEDVSGRGLDEDSHAMVAEDETSFTIKSVPRDPGAVEFAYFVSKIDRSTFLPITVEYYNSSGSVYRIYRVVRTETISGFPTIIDAEMADTVTGGKTVVHFSAVTYGVGLSDEIFSERYLRRAPKKYLR